MGKLSLRYFGPVVWETMLPEEYKNIDNIQINVGDYISEGEKIAEIAKNSSNNHVLHFEVWKDAKKINPENWLIKK